MAEFRQRFSEVVVGWATTARRVPTLHVDAEVNLTDVNLDLIQELEALHPFGAGTLSQPWRFVASMLSRHVWSERSI